MNATGCEIDHIFCLVEDPAPALDILSGAGLRESYRRLHPGQGTQNACFCFDNLYLEILWRSPETVTEEAVLQSTLVERSKLESGANPFGRALRPRVAGNEPNFAHWPYRAPYLPEGAAIPVADISRDISQPFIFWMKNGKPPAQWDKSSGQPNFTTVGSITMAGSEGSGDMAEIANEAGFAFDDTAKTNRLTMILRGRDGNPDATLKLPDFSVVYA